MITNVLRTLGTTGLACYPVGFGCYRINHGNEQHEAALRSYLDRGGNLIDTSANYTDGLSETLAGYVLKDYPRERTIVVTKGGYIQGQNMALAQKHDFPEVVRYQEGLWHCIHPEFLQTQIQLSLDRMQLKKIDVYLLHNPEYFLTEKEHHAGPAPADHEEFYRRVREAFRFLETQVDAGIIGWYGVSSNNFRMPSSEPAMTSVSGGRPLSPDAGAPGGRPGSGCRFLWTRTAGTSALSALVRAGFAGFRFPATDTCRVTGTGPQERRTGWGWRRG